MGALYSEPMCQAAYDNDVHEVYRLFRDDPKSLNVQEASSGETPVIAACRRGNHHVLEYLLRLDADVSIRNKKQRTCLHYAAKRTYSFLDYLMIAILMPILLIGYLILLERQKKNEDLMKLVLTSKVEVNAKDYKGNTALHYACQRKSHKIVPLLLEKEADVSIKNNLTPTTTIGTLNNRRQTVVSLKEKFGVNQSIAQFLEKGETALDIATKLKFKKIIALLKKSG